MTQHSIFRRIGLKLFPLFYVLDTVLVGLLFLPVLLLPKPFPFYAPRVWTRVCMWLLKVCCGITYEIRGLEKVPKSGPVLFACKHQSAWETSIFYLLVPYPAFVLKKELTRIPVLGWYMKALQMIAIDRKAGARALRHMVDISVQRLEEGRQVVIYPEGTRMPYGEVGKYHSGIAAIYKQSGQPVYPVSVDSGKCWPKKGGLTPGHIIMRIHEPIQPGLAKAEFMALLQEKIEGR